MICSEDLKRKRDSRNWLPVRRRGAGVGTGKGVGRQSTMTMNSSRGMAVQGGTFTVFK